MITEQDVQAAIAECEGKRNPGASTCILLAALYIIRREKFGKPDQAETVEPLRLIHGYSRAAAPPEPVENIIDYQSDTEFGRLIYGRNAAEIWPIIDELVSKPVQAFSPRLYDALFRKLKATKSPG